MEQILLNGTFENTLVFLRLRLIYIAYTQDWVILTIVLNKLFFITLFT